MSLQGSFLGSVPCNQTSLGCSHLPTPEPEMQKAKYFSFKLAQLLQTVTVYMYYYYPVMHWQLVRMVATSMAINSTITAIINTTLFPSKMISWHNKFCPIQPVIHHHRNFSLWVLFTIVLSKEISPMGHSGCIPWGKPAATESCYPNYNAYWVFWCFYNPLNSDMDYQDL